MRDEPSRYRTVRGQGRIATGEFEAATAYELHMDEAGRVHLVKFEEHPDSLRDGTTLRLTLENGRALVCQVIDDSPFCSVIGDGRPFLAAAHQESIRDG
jgi:hypothetical protein